MQLSQDTMCLPGAMREAESGTVVLEELWVVWVFLEGRFYHFDGLIHVVCGEGEGIQLQKNDSIGPVTSHTH